MYMIQIARPNLPDSLTSTCVFPATNNLSSADNIWHFMVDHLEVGWYVTLMSEEGRVLEQAYTGDNKNEEG